MPITLWDQKVYIPVAVNGTLERLFVDTGSSVSTLSQAVSDNLSLLRDFDHSADVLEVGGAESRLTLVGPVRFDLGELHVVLPSVPVAEFSARMADDTPVAGLLGADVLSRYDLDLDIRDRQLGLWQVVGCDRITPDWPGQTFYAPIEVAPSRQVSINAHVDDTMLDLVIDTGSAGLILSTRAAAKAGVDLDALDDTRRLGGVGVNSRSFEARLHIFRHFDVAGQVFGDVRAIVVDPGRVQSGDGLLGLDYLKRSRVWLSYSTGGLYIQTPP